MNRRDFIAIGGAALAGGGMTSLPAEAESARMNPASGANPGTNSGAKRPAPLPRRSRPNVLLLMADQLRMDCVGVYGNRDIQTPNLDRLAKEGVRFQNAYTTTPSCCPARSALLTGLGPWSHGMLGYTQMANRRYPVEMPSAMAAAGYYTTSIGKNHFHPKRDPHGYHHLITDESSHWRLGEKPAEESTWEERADYDSWFWSQFPDKDPQATGLGWNDYRGRPFVYPERFHATHWTGETAVRFLERYSRPEPFFLKVSFIRPHSPYDPPKRLYDMYRDAPVPKAQVGDWAARLAPRSDSSHHIWHGKLPADTIRNSRRCYYGNVTFVDEQIGRILDVLERRGALDDTLILFISDHGDMLGDQNLWRKTYGYEQSAHVPMLLRPPAGMDLGPAGQTVRNPVEMRDVLPTFLEAVGAPIPESIEGQSLLQLVKSKGQGWREYIDLEHNICYSPTNHWNGLTDGQWKYIYHAMDGTEQLFHLENDPNELHDLSAQPEHTGELRHWRERLVKHLEIRGPDWVRNGKLIPRPQGMMLSPNFPGYISCDEAAHRSREQLPI